MKYSLPNHELNWKVLSGAILSAANSSKRTHLTCEVDVVILNVNYISSPLVEQHSTDHPERSEIWYNLALWVPDGSSEWSENLWTDKQVNIWINFVTHFVSVRIDVGLDMNFPIFLPMVQIEYKVPNPRRNIHTYYELAHIFIAWYQIICR